MLNQFNDINKQHLVIMEPKKTVIKFKKETANLLTDIDIFLFKDIFFLYTMELY